MKGMLKLSRLYLLVGFVFLTFVTGVLASEKKGVGLSGRNEAERSAYLKVLNVSWYYTWNHRPVEGAAPEFVPMLRTKTMLRSVGSGVLDEQINYFRTLEKVPTLLVFNEPNRSSGDKMSVEEAVRRWPEISVLADSVSAPGTADADPSEPWFDEFYRMANAKNIKYDFMAIHIYTPPDAKLFLEKVDAVYEKYRKPIWITEFAVRDVDAAPWRCKVLCKNRFSEEAVIAFMKIVLPELEKRKFVVRYAWFGAVSQNFYPTNEQVTTSRLFDNEGNLTTVGKYYAEFKWME